MDILIIERRKTENILGKQRKRVDTKIAFSCRAVGRGLCVLLPVLGEGVP